MEFKDRSRKTKEQLQKEIIDYLKTPVEEYSRDRIAGPAHGIRRKTDNEYAGPEFFEALVDLVDQGIVAVIPTTGLTGHDWYKLT